MTVVADETPRAEPDEVARVYARSDRISESGAEIERGRKEGQRITRSKGARRWKHWQLHIIGDRLNRIVAPHIACKKGCGSCCYQSVPISRTLAGYLAEASGKTVKPGVGTKFLELHEVLKANIKRVSGTACPFLDVKAAECTIYEARPLACRMHHSLADSARYCDVRHPGAKVPKADLTFLEVMEAQLDLDDLWADIRDFFSE